MQMTKPVNIHSVEIQNRIKDLAEKGDWIKPDWFFKGHFKYRCDVQQVIRQVIRFWDDVAKKENLFVVPIGAIGLTTSGRWHYHAVPLTSKSLTYRQIKNHWKCGWVHNKKYQYGKGGIPYILDPEKHSYLPVKKPFAPRRWRKKQFQELPDWIQSGSWKVVLNSI